MNMVNIRKDLTFGGVFFISYNSRIFVLSNCGKTKVMKKSKSELWVSYQYGRDIYDVFTTKKEAEKANIENNKMNEESALRFPNLNLLKHPYKVVTLSDAIEDVIDYVQQKTEYDVRYGNEDY